MKIKLKKQLSMGIFGCIVAVIGWILTETQINVKNSLGGDYNISPRFFPHLVLIIIAVSGIGLILGSIIKKNDDVVVIDLKEEAYILLYFLALIGYVLIFKPIGFIFSTMAVACLLLLMQKCKNWKYYVIVCVLTLAVFALFKFGFGIRLPWGFPLNLIFH